jgi:hypothetical protein
VSSPDFFQEKDASSAKVVGDIAQPCKLQGQEPKAPSAHQCGDDEMTKKIIEMLVSMA